MIWKHFSVFEHLESEQSLSLSIIHQPLFAQMTLVLYIGVILLSFREVILANRSIVTMRSRQGDLDTL